MLHIVIVLIAFILLSGIMSITEAAILSVTRAEVEVMVEEKKRGAELLRRIKSRITRAVVVIVVLTNTINVLGPILVGTLTVELYGNSSIGIVTAIITLGTIIFSEIFPKSLGTHYAPRISLLVAPVVYYLTIFLAPFVWPFEQLTSILKKGERRVGTEEQIRSLVRLGHSAGYIETDETRLVHRAFQLNDRSAIDIMTPIANVVSVPAHMNMKRAADLIVSAAYSRYPVLDQDNRVIGILISHDLLTALSLSNDEDSVTSIMRPLLSVAADAKADDLLELFKGKRFHIAVVNQGNTPIGIVTLEDVLEELVGEIEDEKENSS